MESEDVFCLPVCPYSAVLNDFRYGSALLGIFIVPLLRQDIVRLYIDVKITNTSS